MVLVYTILGGYRAVVLTDVLQALFMAAGLVVVPLLGLASVGGLGVLTEALRATDPALLSLTGGFWPLLGGLAIGLGSPGNPHILVRHMSLRDPSEARLAMAVGTAWNLVMAAGALLMGLVGRALYPTGDAFPRTSDGARPDVDFLFPILGQAVSEQYLFAGFVGILLATLFAAVMSTCDSQLLVIASSLVRDFRGRGRSGDAGAGLVSSRLTVGLALAVAVAISFGADRFVHPFVLLSWGALGAAFGPALLLLLYDARTTARGVLAAILGGAGLFALLNQVWPSPWGASGNLHLVPAYALAIGLAWLLRAPRT